MVTQLKNESAKSDSKSMKELGARAAARVTKAIKERTESFTSLSQAAASSFLFGIQFGRWSEFNRLFNELAKSPSGRIDADALRQKFVWRVVDAFGAGGKPNMTADNVQSGWIVRPVSFVRYLENPPEDMGRDQHFSSAKYEGKTPEAEHKRKMMAAGKKAVIEAGEAGLEAIQWLTRETVIRGDTTYDASNFRKDIARAFRNAIRAMKSDPDIGVQPSTIRQIARIAGFEKKEMASLEAQLLEVTPSTPKPESKSESQESDKVPAESEKEAA